MSPRKAGWAALSHSPEPAVRNRASLGALEVACVLGAVLRYRSGRSGAVRLSRSGLSGRSSPPTPPFGGRARKRSERRSSCPTVQHTIARPSRKQVSTKKSPLTSLRIWRRASSPGPGHASRGLDHAVHLTFPEQIDGFATI